MIGKKDQVSDNAMDFNSQEYKLRLAFSKYRINVAGFEKTAMYAAYGITGGALFIILMVLGFSALTSVIGFAGGFILINGLVAGAWSDVRTQVESEIPSFLVGFTSTVQVTQDVLIAVEEETRTLKEWDNAFLMASTNLEGVLEARSIGIAAGKSAKDSVKLIAAITGGIIIMMVRNPAMADAMAMPLVQIAYGLIILLMLFGWTFMNDMIDSIF